MNEQPTQTPPPAKIEVQLPPEVKMGRYANTARVSVTPAEVTLDFIYMNANDVPNAILVSRVMLARKTAISLHENLRQILDIAQENNPE